jgi:hypothetical protein
MFREYDEYVKAEAKAKLERKKRVTKMTERQKINSDKIKSSILSRVIGKLMLTITNIPLRHVLNTTANINFL